MFTSAEFVENIVVKLLKKSLSSNDYYSLGGSKNTLRNCVERNKGVGATVVEILYNLIEQETKYDEYKRSLIIDYLKNYLNPEELNYLNRNPDDLKTIITIAASKFSKNSSKKLSKIIDIEYTRTNPFNEGIILKPNATIKNINKLRYNSLLNLCAPIKPTIFKETLRERFLQIALDVFDMRKALELASIAVQFCSVIIEVGDPLIKRFGMDAVRQIRKLEPKFPLLVEMVSSDWVDDQVSLAAEAGADIVLLMGIYNESRVEKAVDSARRNGVGLILELSPMQKVGEWCSIFEEYGVDGIALIRNIDSLNRPKDMINKVSEVRRKSTLPIVVSGGFTPKIMQDIINEDWNIVIVGRAIVNSPEPRKNIEQILNIIHSGR